MVSIKGVMMTAIPLVSVCFMVAAAGGFAAENSSIARTMDRLASLAGERQGAAEYVKYLSDNIGIRVGGSDEALKAAKWAENKFRSFGLENVHLEECSKFENEKYGGTIYNVVADIAGTEIPDEYVIVGAHIDCTPYGTGASDNAAGAGTVLEAARLLAEAGARPQRTIRFILFGGEEVGLVGSRAYVRDHPELLAKISAVYNMDNGSNYISGLKVTPPMMKQMESIFQPVLTDGDDFTFGLKKVDFLPTVDPDCCATAGGADSSGVVDGKKFVFSSCGAPCVAAKSGEGEVLDPEAMGIPMKEVTAVTSSGDTVKLKLALPGGVMDDEQVQSILKELDIDALAKEMAEGRKTESSSKMKIGMALGSSDHAPFLNAGVPAFTWIQDGDPGFKYPLHSEKDNYDLINPGYLQHSALVVAMAAFRTASLDSLVPRDVLMKPTQKAILEVGTTGK